jgi:hypothetical protein
MKVALCFFGITRNLRANTLPSLQTCLMAALAEKDPHYRKFGHFNLIPSVSNPRAGENNIPLEPEEFKLLECDTVSTTDQSWLDEHLDFGSIQKFGDVWEDNFASLKNLMRQLYSLEQVTSLLLAAKERFDVVVYSRADLRFERKVEIPRIRPRTLYTSWFGKGGGLNDRFAMGDFETMVKYGQRGKLARRYCEATGKPLHAERFLLWSAKKHGLRRADLTSIDFSRVRANGAVPEWDVVVKTRSKDRRTRAWSRLKNILLRQ